MHRDTEYMVDILDAAKSIKTYVPPLIISLEKIIQIEE